MPPSKILLVLEVDRSGSADVEHSRAFGWDEVSNIDCARIRIDSGSPHIANVLASMNSSSTDESCALHSEARERPV